MAELSRGITLLSKGPYLPYLSLHHSVKMPKIWAEMLPWTNKDMKSVLFIWYVNRIMVEIAKELTRQ